MKIKIGKRQTEKWYYFTLGLWFFFEIITQANVTKIFGIDIYILDDLVTGIVLLCTVLICILGQKYSKREIILIIIITLLILIATINSHVNSLISAWMFIVASKNINLHKTVRIVFKLLFLATLLIIGLSLLGIIPENIMYRNGNIRHSLGFSHPNQLALRIFQLAACYCFLRWNEFGIGDIGIISFLLIFIVKVTNSQTAAICTVLLLILTAFAKWSNRRFTNANVILGTVYWWIGVGTAFSSVFLTLINAKEYSILRTVDQILSARFSEGYKVYRLYGVSLFGQRIFVTPEERILVGLHTRLWLDSAYCNLLLRFGIIIFCVFCIAYFCTFYSMKNIPIMAVLLLVYAIYGVMEGSLIQLTHNVFLIALAWTIYKDKSIDELSEER